MYDKLNHSSDCPADDKFVKVIESKVSSDKYHYCDLCFSTFIERIKDGCCKTPSLQFVRYPASSGKYQLRKQCRSCFTLQGLNYKHSEVKDINLVQLFVQQKEDYYLIKSKEYSRFIEWVASKRKVEFFKQHDNYLNTPAWRQIREAVLKRDNYVCQGCLIVRATQVHHLTYERWKNEMAFDLISLCTPCHNKIHSK